MQQGEIHKFTVTDLNNEGEGVVRAGDERFVLFVPDALPGEEVTCRIVQKKKNYAIAKVLERHTTSPDRVAPQCPHFGRCGGCQLQHMNYDAQLRMKTKTVYDALKRIGGAEEPPVADCAPSPSIWGYRNKASVPVQRTAKEKFRAGFYKPRSHEIVPFEVCPVLLPELEQKMKAVISIFKENGFSGCDETHIKDVTNFIRHIVIRQGKFSGESLCGVVGTKKMTENRQKQFSALESKIKPLFNGLIYNENASTGNFIWGDQFTTLYGTSTMKETLHGLDFSFEVSSFFQINSEQTENLYQFAAKHALEDSPENILELYSGVGSLTAFLAKGAKQVTAIESWEPAAKYLEENAKVNGLDNIESHFGKSEDVIKDLSHNHYNVVVLDPPRTGCQPEVIDAILQIKPQKIVYVSCNPATLARDIKPLLAQSYKLQTAQPFDMFPQTGHVECVACLQKTNNGGA